MSNLKNNIKKVVSDTPSGWKQGAEYRLKNKWLRYSSQIARRILAIIEDNKELNQAKLADLLKVSPQQINKIVKGKENLTLETIYKLSKALQFELITFPPYKYSYKIQSGQLANPIEFDHIQTGPEKNKEANVIPLVDYNYSPIKEATYNNLA